MGFDHIKKGGGGGDGKVKVSSNDSTPDFLENKITSANSAITISTLNDGSDEDLQLTFNENAITITESQISDLGSYLTSESDTLQAVTDRGASTTNTVTLSPTGNNDGLIANGVGSGSGIDITHNGSGASLKITHSGSGAQIDGNGFDVDNDGDVTAKSFITSGGTSSQFVKGDGSLDSSTYLTEAASDALYLKLDTTNDPLVGDLEIDKTTPKITLTNDNPAGTYFTKDESNNEFHLSNDVIPFNPENALNLTGSGWCDRGSNVSVGTVYTIDFWFKTSTVNGDMMLTGGNGYHLFWFYTATTIRAYIGTTSYSQWTVSSVNNNAWTHWCLVRNGRDQTLYRNGSSLGTVTASGTQNFSSFYRYLGSSSGTSNFVEGSIDQFVVWNKALDSSEVAARYNSGSGAGVSDFTDVVACYRFNDTYTDASPNGYNLSAVGSGNSFVAGIVQSDAGSTSTAKILRHYDSATAGSFGEIELGIYDAPFASLLRYYGYYHRFYLDALMAFSIEYDGSDKPFMKITDGTDGLIFTPETYGSSIKFVGGSSQLRLANSSGTSYTVLTDDGKISCGGNPQTSPTVGLTVRETGNVAAYLDSSSSSGTNTLLLQEAGSTSNALGLNRYSSSNLTTALQTVAHLWNYPGELRIGTEQNTPKDLVIGANGTGGVKLFAQNASTDPFVIYDTNGQSKFQFDSNYRLLVGTDTAIEDVTLAGDTIILDSATLGSDLVVNGAFATDTVWTKAHVSWTITSGYAQQYNSTLAPRELYQSITAENGALYEMQFDLIEALGDNWTLYFSWAGYTSETLSPPDNVAGTYKFQFRSSVSGASNFSFFATSDSLSRVRIDNVSLKKIEGGDLIVNNLTTTKDLTVTNDSITIATSKTPSSATDTGTTGQVAWDSSYIYVCVATDTWVRAALSTW